MIGGRAVRTAGVTMTATHAPTARPIVIYNSIAQRPAHSWNAVMPRQRRVARRALNAPTTNADANIRAAGTVTTRNAAADRRLAGTHRPDNARPVADQAPWSSLSSIFFR